MKTRVLMLVMDFALAASGAVAAEVECARYDKVLVGLSAGYRETPVAAGLAMNGSLVQVLVSADGRSWTIVASDSGGTACLIAAGIGWHAIPENPADAPQPAALRR